MRDAEILYGMKKKILDIVCSSREGHMASSFSILDILWVLYDRVLNVCPKTSSDYNRDRFVLSKGHSSLGLYVVLAEKGFITQEELNSFCKFNSMLGGHPNHNKIKGVEASTGSLGNGLAISVGLALGLKTQWSNAKTYCIVGDGEVNEGIIWESALLAQQYKLNNLYCIVDHNHSGDRAINMGSIADKFHKFGWYVDIISGHNHYDLTRVLSRSYIDKPTAIIAETIKGKGCPTIENNASWHHRTPTKKEYDILLEELLCEKNSYKL